MARGGSRKKKYPSTGTYRDHEQCLVQPGGKHARLRIALVFSNTYYVGMSNLGFQLAYRLCALHPDVRCERFFLPEPSAPASVQARGLRSIESGSPLGAFDCIAFSLSFESDYVNVVRMLAMAGIPALRSGRTAGSALLLGGGVAVSMNPEPLAEIFDLLAIGEAESILPGFIERALEGSRPGRSCRLQAEDFEHIGGMYVPGRVSPLYEGQRVLGLQGAAQAGLPVSGRRPSELDSCHGSSCILTPYTQFADMALVEVSRGCSRRCRFCAVGCLYPPYRIRSLESLTAEIEPFLERGIKIGLLGAAVSDYPDLVPLMRAIVDRGGHVSIASLRADALTPDMVSLLVSCGHKTFTIAPEAATQRLRDVLGKGISHNDIMRAAEMFADHGVSSIRLYFMIGLPGERDEDIDAIAELAIAIAARYRTACGKNSLRRLTISVSPFVPKPFTPFQWHPFDSVDRLKQKATRIRNALRDEKKIVLSVDSPRMSLVQAVLSTGDRRLSRVLLSAHELQGNWTRAFRANGFDPDAVACRGRLADEFLPWDVIDHGIDKDRLWQSYQKALNSF